MSTFLETDDHSYVARWLYLSTLSFLSLSVLLFASFSPSYPSLSSSMMTSSSTGCSTSSSSPSIVSVSKNDQLNVTVLAYDENSRAAVDVDIYDYPPIPN